MLRTLIVASVALAFAVVAATKLPKDFKRCKKHDPRLNDCLMDAIQKSLPYLVKGIPSLGLMSIDPLRITQLSIDQGSGPVSIKLDFRDLDIKGLRAIKLNTVKADWDKLELEADVHVEMPLNLQGLYKINGKVLILPIQGAGRSNLTLENVAAKIRVIGKPLKKNGETYMDVDKLLFNFTTTKLHIFLENLFSGDKALGDNMNKFLNENWEDILKELQPSIQSALGQAFQVIANRIFHKVPLNHIYLSD